MFPKIVEFARYVGSDEYLGRLGRMTKVYWTVWTINIVQIGLMIFGPETLKHSGWFVFTNTLGTIALLLMLVAAMCAQYQDGQEKAPQAD